MYGSVSFLHVIVYLHSHTWASNCLLPVTITRCDSRPSNYYELKFSSQTVYRISSSISLRDQSVISHPVLHLWENQRRGVSNVFLTYFDYFFGGQYELGKLRGTREGVKPPTSRQIEHCSHLGIHPLSLYQRICWIVGSCVTRTYMYLTLT